MPKRKILSSTYRNENPVIVDPLWRNPPPPDPLPFAIGRDMMFPANREGRKLKYYIGTEADSKSEKKTLDKVGVKHRLISFARISKRKVGLADYIKTSKGKEIKQMKSKKASKPSWMSKEEQKLMEEGKNALNEIVWPAIEKSVKEIKPAGYKAELTGTGIDEGYVPESGFRYRGVLHYGILVALNITPPPKIKIKYPSIGSQLTFWYREGGRIQAGELITPLSISKEQKDKSRRLAILPTSKVNEKWVRQKVEKFIKAAKAVYKA